MKPLSRPKTRPVISTSSTNLLSEKVIQRCILTPKKEIYKNISSSKGHRDSRTPYHKSSKININMEIKNLNIFSPPSPVSHVLKKKKIHRRAASNIAQPPKQLKQLKEHLLIEKERPVRQDTSKPKHSKTKSQECLKISPNQWSEILAEHRTQQGEKEDIISNFGFCNRKGFTVDKKDKNNQDTYIFIKKFMTASRNLLGVCDGHGVHGHFVSEFIKEILPENIQYFFIKNKAVRKNTRLTVQSCLKEAFLKTAKDLENSGIDTQMSGSTACLLYIQNNTIFCANLGDSRAVLFNRTGETWSTRPVSTDHKAEDSKEAYRIKMNGGRVFPFYDEDGEQLGPYRVWIKQGKVPGLAMTRSFGDFIASTVGVISQPEITHYEMGKESKFLVVATDGLWQFVSNEEVMNIVIPCFIRNNVNQAVQLLEKAAVDAWKREDENIDDITIEVIFFKHY